MLAAQGRETQGDGMKSALLTKLTPPLVRIAPEDAIFEFYNRSVDTDIRLNTKAKLLLGWLCVLASGENGVALPYALPELNRKFNWTTGDMHEAARLAAAAGYIRLDGDVLALTRPPHQIEGILTIPRYAVCVQTSLHDAAKVQRRVPPLRQHRVKNPIPSPLSACKAG